MKKQPSLLGNINDREATAVEIKVLALLKRTPSWYPENSITIEKLQELNDLPINAREVLQLTVDCVLDNMKAQLRDLIKIKNYLDEKPKIRIIKQQ